MAPERLTALDASFLYLERPQMHMHVAGLSLLDPSTRPDGRLPFTDVEAVVASRIHVAPRLRQRVVEVPGRLAPPVWVDDEHFDLDFHVRRAAIPSPGGRGQLAEAVGRVLSRPLDRSKPLWELYVFEGLEDGLVAVLLKMHHAIVDGVSGMRIGALMFDLSPDLQQQRHAPEPWNPPTAPTRSELMRTAIEEQLRNPLSVVMQALETPQRAAESVRIALSSARGLLGMGRRPTGPFDVAIGPNRRFAMAEAPFERFRQVKHALGGTVNDVVLTVVAGSLHELLAARGEPTRGRTLRAMVPVSVRGSEQPAESGNRVAPAFVDIPVGAMSPRTRLARIRKGTRSLKESMMALGADSIIALGAFAPAALHAAGARLASRGQWFNLVVSNIPAPQVPLYLAGARLLANYPAMPLGENAGLSIAVTSLGGTMAFGFTADWDGVPDVEALAARVEGSLEQLAKEAGV